MKTIVIFTRDRVQHQHATVLETRLTADGPVVQSIPIPASETRYNAGQTLTFRSKRDAVDFVKAIGDACEIRTADP